MMLVRSLFALFGVVSAVNMEASFWKAMNGMSNPGLRNVGKQQMLANLIKTKGVQQQPNQHRRAEQYAEMYENFGFDVSQYSLKYNGCKTVQTYSDEKAEEEQEEGAQYSSVLVAKRFVIFRLCPTANCNSYSLDGCSEDYGEYLIEMDDYLQAMYEYQNQKEESYCEYCRACFQNNRRRLNDNWNGDNWNGNGNDDGANWNNNNGNNNNGNNNNWNNGNGNYNYNNNNDDWNGGNNNNNNNYNNGGNGNGNGNDDWNNNNYNNNNNGGNGNDDWNNNNGNNNNNNNNNNNGQWCDYNVCQDVSMCVQQEFDDDQARAAAEVNFEEFFECREVEQGDDGNAAGVFIAPHCASDGYTIQIATYSDQYCTYYDGSTSVNDVLGFELNQTFLEKYTSEECTSCLESDNVYENANGDNNDNNLIIEVCENLYGGSAKCNKNMEQATGYSYESEQQYAQAEVVCEYISALETNTYSETGELILDASSGYYFNVSNWRSGSEYAKEAQYFRETTAGWQIAWLVLAILGIVVMSVWACCLHGSLQKKGFLWKPRFTKDMDPKELNRQPSGILMGRSRSERPGADAVLA